MNETKVSKLRSQFISIIIIEVFIKYQNIKRFNNSIYSPALQAIYFKDLIIKPIQ